MQSVEAPVCFVALSRQPASRLHAGGQATDGALLKTKALGKVLLGQLAVFGEFAEGEDFGHRYVHSAVIVRRMVGLKQSTCTHEVLEQSAQFVVRESG